MTGTAPSRPLYRVRQFWHTLHARPSQPDLDLARSVLSARQLALFCQMQPAEQVHSLGVLRQLQEQADLPLELQVAALLHDAGKTRAPLRLWERVWIVLARALAPAWAQRQGSLPLRPKTPSWQRPLIVACQHPEWGARLAEEAGVSPLTAAIIRRHQQKISTSNGSPEEDLLLRLQAVDDRS